MKDLSPSYTVVADLEKREVHFTAAGLWDETTLAGLSAELLKEAKPLYSQGLKIRVLGDLRGFVTQKREIADGIRLVVNESHRLGVTHTAIVADSTLAAMQYKRINEGINLEIFKTKSEAIDWLRSKEAV